MIYKVYSLGNVFFIVLSNVLCQEVSSISLNYSCPPSLVYTREPVDSRTEGASKTLYLRAEA